MVLYFHNPIVHRTVSTISTNKCSSTLVNFHLLIPPLSVHKIILTLPTNTPFLYTWAIFPLLNFGYYHPNNLSLKIFLLPQQFSQFRLRQGTWELGSLVRTDTVLISPFFLKVLAVITRFAITDSLSLRLRKLVYCR